MVQVIKGDKDTIIFATVDGICQFFSVIVTLYGSEIPQSHQRFF